MKKRIHILDVKTKIILAIILVVAAFFRFYNLNWDQGQFFHPDERNIANAVSSITLFSQMDPRFYAYGGFLIYLYKFTADCLVFLLHNPSIAHDWGWINLIGRSYSAFFSVMTLLPLYLLGTKVFGRKVGFLSCLIYAFTVSSIQTAHFSTTENLLTFFIVLITFLSILFYERPSLKSSLLIGILIGLAVATKTTGVSFFVAPSIALLFLFLKKRLRLPRVAFFAICMGSAALVLFTICSPFTFLNWSKFMESMHYENSVVLGTNRVVYTLQFLHKPLYLFQITNLFWQLGIFALIALIGIIFSLYKGLLTRKMPFFLFTSFPFLYFLYVGSWYTKFNRYMVPILPFFIIFGCNFLIWLISRYRRLGMILTGSILILTIFYSFAFLSIYTHPQTRISASNWIYNHIPPGKFILSEHWDEGLPIPRPDHDPSEYQQLPLTIYEPDNAAKLDYYANYLSQADYVSINSRRLYGTLLYLPDKYPLTSRYYQLLFSNKLGYTKIAEFTSYPQLFGITINDDNSEETFQVYDHPKALIFQNTRHYSFQQLKKILGS